MIIVALTAACSGKNADGTPNVSSGDTSHTKRSLPVDSTIDSTSNAPADVKH